jgi:hypothetical protein
MEEQMECDRVQRRRTAVRNAAKQAEDYAATRVS